MSNEKNVNNHSRRIRKGCKRKVSPPYIKSRPLRTKTTVLADELMSESPMLENYIFFNRTV